MEPELCLKSIENYKNTSLKVLKRKLSKFFEDPSHITIENIKKHASKINAYQNLKDLKPLNIEQVYILDDNNINTDKAKQCIINGEFFWEHACAGEATRLGLGTKYLINPSTFTKDQIINLISQEKSKNNQTFTNEQQNDLKESLIEPNTLLPLTLGQRHILQIVYDINKLAAKHNLNPQEIIQKQQMLLILNKKTQDTIVNEWKTYNFYSFKPENIFFMVQEDFHGITFTKDDKNSVTFNYEEHTQDNKRLHNHGQMMMQKMHDKSIFHFKQLNDNANKSKFQKTYLSQEEYLNLLKHHKDMVSFNIEDVDYLTSSIDYPSLQKAIELGEKGYGMVMEIVGQNKDNPIKGGAAFFDPIKNKNVMIEGFMLENIKPEEITLLNKNFNHYPNPALTMQTLQKSCLHMPIKIKKAANDKEYIYFEPVQGDMNFLVKTAFMMRKELKPINALKKPSNIPNALKAMQKQDMQPGFKELTEKFKCF